MSGFTFGVAISEEVLGEKAPVLFQGGILQGMAQAAELGFGSVELHVRDPHTLDAAAISARAEALGLKVAAIGTGLENSRNGHCMTAPDAAERRAALDAMLRHIEFAAHFDAVVFIGLIRGEAGRYALKPEKLELFAAELRPLAQAARDAGVRTGLEPVAYYFSDLLNTTAETVAFLEEHDLSLGLLLDTHHMYLEDPDLADAFRLAGDRITHVHASDSNRRAPGAGNVDYEVVARSLQQLNYTGALSLEVLPLPDGTSAAKAGLLELQRTWSNATDVAGTKGKA